MARLLIPTLPDSRAARRLVYRRSSIPAQAAGRSGDVDAYERVPHPKERGEHQKGNEARGDNLSLRCVPCDIVYLTWLLTYFVSDSGETSPAATPSIAAQNSACRGLSCMLFARSAMPSTAAPACLLPSINGWFEMMARHRRKLWKRHQERRRFRRMRQRALQVRSRAAPHRVHLGRRQSDLSRHREPRELVLSWARESRSLGKLVEDVGVLVHEVNGYGNHTGLGDSGCR